MKTILVLVTLVLALRLPHDYIVTAFWFFVAFAFVTLCAFVVVLVLGWAYAWRNFRRTHISR